MKLPMILVAAVATLAAFAGPGAQSQPVTVLEGATVIDAVSASPIADAAIEIQGGLIIRIGRRGSFSIPSGATRVDLAGKTVIPALINAHTHVTGTRPPAEGSATPRGGAIERNAGRYLFYGITHAMSLGTDGSDVDAYLREQAAGRTTGAHVFFAGFGSSAMGGWQGANKNLHRPATPEEGRAAVRAELPRHVEAIKFWVDSDHGKLPVLAPDVYGAIIDEAHKNHLKAYCHMFSLDDSKELVRRGLDVLAHSIRDKVVDDEFLKLAKQHGLVSIPALVGHASVYAYQTRPAFLDDPGLPFLYAKDLLTDLGSPENQRKVADDPRVPVVRQEVAIAMQNAGKMAAAGIPIALGTDAGPGAVLLGLADHLEMEMLVQSGLSPMQALRAATINSAKVLGVDKKYGTLERGKAANFIVLTADPLTDIRNTRKIDAVWVDGHPVDRQALARGTAVATQ